MIVAIIGLWASLAVRVELPQILRPSVPVPIIHHHRPRGHPPVRAQGTDGDDTLFERWWDHGGKDQYLLMLWWKDRKPNEEGGPP